MTHVFLSLLILGSSPSTFDVFSDKGDLFVRAGKNRGLRVGNEVELLGDRIGNTEERRVVGKASIMEVFDTIARVSPDDGAKETKAKAARLAMESAAPSRGTPVAAKREEGQGCADPKRPVTQANEGWDFHSYTTQHLSGKCCGVKAELYVAFSTLIGWDVKLLVDDGVAEEQHSNGGQFTLKGNASGKAVELDVDLGQLTGTYDLRIGGKPCQLTAL